ncbi:hypothetical protein EV286_11770 [Rhizobium sp. BK251]|nr:hypothetical protein EV286_11770 [Rhizobium sp. BK251]
MPNLSILRQIRVICDFVYTKNYTSRFKLSIVVRSAVAWPHANTAP